MCGFAGKDAIAVYQDGHLMAIIEPHTETVSNDRVAIQYFDPKKAKEKADKYAYLRVKQQQKIKTASSKKRHKK